jgi:hypothetical protein
MEEPLDDHEHEVPPAVARSRREASPLWTLLRAIEDHPLTWGLDLL